MTYEVISGVRLDSWLCEFVGLLTPCSQGYEPENEQAVRLVIKFVTRSDDLEGHLT